MPRHRVVPETAPAITLLSREELAQHLGCSTWSITYWVQRGVLPQPIRFAGNCHKWRVVDIEKALERMQRAPYVPQPLRGRVKVQLFAQLHAEEMEASPPRLKRVRLSDPDDPDDEDTAEEAPGEDTAEEVRS